MGFLGNLLGNAVSNAVNQTVGRTVSNAVADATSKGITAATNGAKTAIANSKTKMREKVLEGAQTYRDNPKGTNKDGAQSVLFASDKQVKYTYNDQTYAVDVVGVLAWKDTENNYAEADPSFYANFAYFALNDALLRLAMSSEPVEPSKLSSRMLNIATTVNYHRP